MPKTGKKAQFKKQSLLPESETDNQPTAVFYLLNLIIKKPS